MAKTNWNRYYNNDTIPGSLEIGSFFEPSFYPGSYVFAIEVKYRSVNKESLTLKRTDITKMYICGDSITAGFPYISNMDSFAMNEDIRWGKQVARRLGFQVEFGASSGNGWVYSTGSANAYSITKDTDFSKYDVAIYAWGTNDYYHNSELGSVEDDDFNTVCGRING